MHCTAIILFSVNIFHSRAIVYLSSTPQLPTMMWTLVDIDNHPPACFDYSSSACDHFFRRILLSDGVMTVHTYLYFLVLERSTSRLERCAVRENIEAPSPYLGVKRNRRHTLTLSPCHVQKPPLVEISRITSRSSSSRRAATFLRLHTGKIALYSSLSWTGICFGTLL